MKEGGSCEMMKSWCENDVAARMAAKRPKSVNCQLGSGQLVRAKRKAEMKNGGSRETGYEDWGGSKFLEGPLFQLYNFR